MEFLDKILLKSQTFNSILTGIFDNKNTVSITGLADIHKAHFAHSICNLKHLPALLIVPNEAIAQKMVADITAMGSRGGFFPSRDFNFYNIEGQSADYEHQRIRVLSQILCGHLDIVIATIDAVMQFTAPKSTFSNATFSIGLDTKISPEDAVKKLINAGYTRSDQVDGPGQFSLRGGILDIFSTNSNNPVRIEFWGDTIDSMSFFDVTDQRRTEKVDTLNITPAREILLGDTSKLLAKMIELQKRLESNKFTENAINTLNSETESLQNTGNIGSRDKFISLICDSPGTLLDYFPSNAMVFICEQAQVDEKLRAHRARWEEDLRLYLEDGVLCSSLTSFSLDKSDFLRLLSNKHTVYFDLFLTQSYFSSIDETFAFNARQIAPWNGNIHLLTEELSSAGKEQSVVILAGNETAANRIVFDLSPTCKNIHFVLNPLNIQTGTKIVTPGALSCGFEYPEINFSLIACGRAAKSQKFFPKKKNKPTSIYSLADLHAGDYVVHSLHGIGIFKGVHKLEVQGVAKDYIKISYAKGDTLYVPVTQLDLVDKYIGPAAETRVKLNKLGSSDWQKSKSRVKKATQDIAKELIKLYSERVRAKGYAFAEDGELQRDFEVQFEYTETPDQMRCIDEIKADMQRIAPMDRLLCGDVGFGKTEVALRAAFKCVCDSKQCAILVPTTILAWQHFETILARFRSFPVKIEMLSRFRTPRQQESILKRLKRGEIDIIVGNTPAGPKRRDFPRPGPRNH